MVDLLLQNSGPFLCKGGSSEPTEPPGYEPVEPKIFYLLLWQENKGKCDRSQRRNIKSGSICVVPVMMVASY